MPPSFGGDAAASGQDMVDARGLQEGRCQDLLPERYRLMAYIPLGYAKEDQPWQFDRVHQQPQSGRPSAQRRRLSRRRFDVGIDMLLKLLEGREGRAAERLSLQDRETSTWLSQDALVGVK
jgi:hypothetical protein